MTLSIVAITYNELATPVSLEQLCCLLEKSYLLHNSGHKVKFVMHKILHHDRLEINIFTHSL